MLWAWILRGTEVVDGEVSAAAARERIGGRIAMTVIRRGSVGITGTVRGVVETGIVAIGVTGIGRGPGLGVEAIGEGRDQGVRTETSTEDISQRTMATRRIAAGSIARIDETEILTTISGADFFSNHY